MPDSVGLYVGNAVTQMGYKIGAVNTIKPEGTGVEIGFTVTGHHPIPRDVKAVTRSPSILADRSLELVGNYSAGPQLVAGECIPRSQSFTPMSISQVIGSATKFLNGINPQGSTNIEDAVRGIDQATTGNGAGLNRLLTSASSLLDNPDEAITELGSVVRKTAELTSMLKANRDPLKQILRDAPITTPDIVQGLMGTDGLVSGLGEIVQFGSDLERDLGTELQLTLDTVGDAIRHLSPHYKGIANMLNPLPRYISGLGGEAPGATAGALAKHLNNHAFYLLRWRPPLYRIERPDLNGLQLCGQMNASMPGSCTDVAGKPYAVDVALLQYILMKAQRK